jgi:hypothetical protein
MEGATGDQIFLLRAASKGAIEPANLMRRGSGMNVRQVPEHLKMRYLNYMKRTIKRSIWLSPPKYTMAHGRRWHTRYTTSRTINVRNIGTISAPSITSFLETLFKIIPISSSNLSRCFLCFEIFRLYSGNPLSKSRNVVNIQPLTQQ